MIIPKFLNQTPNVLNVLLFFHYCFLYSVLLVSKSALEILRCACFQPGPLQEPSKRWRDLCQLLVGLGVGRVPAKGLLDVDNFSANGKKSHRRCAAF